MLTQHRPATTVPVSDIQRAKQFYEGVLGFSDARQTTGGTLYTVDGSDVMLYESPGAGTNESTMMAFEVPDEEFDSEIDALRDNGVEFLTFDLEGATWNNGIASMGDVKGAWFRDPDGNIIAVSPGITA